LNGATPSQLLTTTKENKAMDKENETNCKEQKNNDTTIQGQTSFHVPNEKKKKKWKRKKRKPHAKQLRCRKLIPTGCVKKSRTPARAEGLCLPNSNTAGTTCIQDSCYICMKELDGDEAPDLEDVRALIPSLSSGCSTLKDGGNALKKLAMIWCLEDLEEDSSAITPFVQLLS
jgi:hypothetical protein